jgi:hypothetical protein
MLVGKRVNFVGDDKQINPVEDDKVEPTSKLEYINDETVLIVSMKNSISG